MDLITNQVHISWLILIYDRTAKERFPLKRKWYVFSYERASEEEIEQVIKLCCKKSEFPPPIKSPRIGDVQVSYSVGSNNYTDHKILSYRHLFDYVSGYEGGDHKDQLFSSYRSVNLTPETYYEDENEKSISFLQIADEESHRINGENGFAIVKDIPESIFRLEPIMPIREDLWKKTDADIFALFFKQLNFIHNSRWINSPCQVSPISKEKCHARLPLQEDCMAVMLSFRQMYSNNDSDNLFNKICTIYKRHCPKEHPTYHWVEDYQKDFNTILEGYTNFPIQDCRINVRRYLNAFAYGARVVHVRSKKEESALDLEYLLNKFRREEVIMQYHVILHNLMSKMLMVRDVLRKNVGHWISNIGWEGPSGKPIGSGIFN